MEQTHSTNWEQSLEQLARRFKYPATPDIAAAVAGDQRSVASYRQSPVARRLAWALVIVVLVAAVLFAAPQTRAALLSLFARIGAIEIFIDDAEPSPDPTAAATADPSAPVGHSLALFELGEPAALDEAQESLGFPLILPVELGKPDEVYIHRTVDWRAATLVWRGPDGAPLSLTEIRAPQFAMKSAGAEDVKHLSIDGRPAVFIEGPHFFRLLDGWQTEGLLIESSVLIWAADGVTYRLEGDLSEAEMIGIAESIPASP